MFEIVAMKKNNDEWYENWTAECETLYDAKLFVSLMTGNHDIQWCESFDGNRYLEYMDKECTVHFTIDYPTNPLTDDESDRS